MEHEGLERRAGLSCERRRPLEPATYLRSIDPKEAESPHGRDIHRVTVHHVPD